MHQSSNNGNKLNYDNDHEELLDYLLYSDILNNYQFLQS